MFLSSSAISLALPSFLPTEISNRFKWNLLVLLKLSYYLLFYRDSEFSVFQLMFLSVAFSHRNGWKQYFSAMGLQTSRERFQSTALTPGYYCLPLGPDAGQCQFEGVRWLKKIGIKGLTYDSLHRWLDLDSDEQFCLSWLVLFLFLPPCGAWLPLNCCDCWLCWAFWASFDRLTCNMVLVTWWSQDSKSSRQANCNAQGSFQVSDYITCW